MVSETELLTLTGDALTVYTDEIQLSNRES